MENKDPKENTPPTPVSPVQDAKQRSDWKTTKQTDEPWKGNPEMEQLDPDRPDIDLEKWAETNTH